MKKYTAFFITTLLASLLSSATFATISVSSPQGLTPRNYGGPIQSVTYAANTQSVTVIIDTDKSRVFYPHVGLVTVIFDGDDFAFGSSISPAVGQFTLFDVGTNNVVGNFNVSSANI